MDAYEIIETIRRAEKKTPVKVVLREVSGEGPSMTTAFAASVQCFPMGPGTMMLYGDWRDIGPVLDARQNEIVDLVIESDRRNSALPLLDMKHLHARIEPGAIIRDQVEIGENAVIMMGAILNIGAVVGEGSMIDMGAVLGGRATVGKRCHIGAGAVLAGVIEPASATPVVVEDDVLVGANAVLIEGVRVGTGAVVAAGAVVLEDVPANAMVAGVPARIVKWKDEKTRSATGLLDALREL